MMELTRKLITQCCFCCAFAPYLYEQQLDVSEELISTTRCIGLNGKPVSPWTSALPLSYPVQRSIKPCWLDIHYAHAKCDIHTYFS